MCAGGRNPAPPLLAEAEILKLHHGDDGIVVIGLHEINVVGCQAGHVIELAAIHRPAAAGLHRVFRESIVPFNRRQDARERQAER